MSKKKKIMRIPDFKSYEEEAKWWDNHSLADMQHLFKQVKVTVAKNLSSSMNIRFDPKTLNKLRTVAHKKGIRPSTLARMWIVERVRSGEPNTKKL